MGWLARKIDSLVGGVFAAAGGVTLSQFQAFIHQYLQRLGGHMDEARRHFDQAREAGRYATLDENTRQAIVADAWQRLEDIQRAHSAIKAGDFFTRPIAFFRHMENDIALRTLTDFQPAIPIDADSLIYAAIGMVLALMAWELVKAPFAAMARPRRGFAQKKGGA